MDDELCHITGTSCPYTLPIGGRPLIRHALGCLRDAGAGEVLIVAAAELFEDIAESVGDPGIELHYAIHPGNECESSALAAARETLGEGPVIVHRADSFLPGGLGDIRPGQVYAVGGRPVAAAFDALPESLDMAGGELVELEDGWAYDGTVDGVLEANTTALDTLKRARIGADLSKASVQGRVAIHPTAILDGAKIRGPVQIGAGAVVIDTYVGPYTSIGAGVRLESVEIENSIVLPSAVIRYPGRRIEASLVGEGAQIGRDFSLPSALRLRVGRGADIQLS